VQGSEPHPTGYTAANTTRRITVTSVLEQIENALGGDSDSDDSLSAEATWKLVSVGAGVGSAIVARKLLAKVWPSSDDDKGFVSAAQWAIASGIAVGVARMVGQRVAEKAWERATGSTPPGQSA
jgi:hypothetical protein